MNWIFFIFFSRFDLVYLLLDKPNKEDDRRLATHIVSLYISDTPTISETDFIVSWYWILPSRHFRKHNYTQTHTHTHLSNNFFFPFNASNFYRKLNFWPNTSILRKLKFILSYFMRLEKLLWKSMSNWGIWTKVEKRSLQQLVNWRVWFD